MASSRVASVVSSHWLKSQLTNKVGRLRVLDTSWGLTKSGHEAYQAEHVPGALFFDLNRCVNPRHNLPRALPNPSCFTEYVRSLGVSRDSHLVLYDRGIMLAAARLWWNFRAYGHENVSVLDGGLTQWKNDGLSVESGPMALPEEHGDFEVKLKTKLVADYESVLGASHQGNLQILDARGHAHFKGEAEEPTDPTRKAYEGLHLAIPSRLMQAGHITGSINLMEDDLINKETKCLKSKEDIAKVFQSAGVDLGRPMTTMCYNGNAACLLALGASLCGKEDVSVYYGSWTEFSQRASPEDVVKGDKALKGGA